MPSFAAPRLDRRRILASASAGLGLAALRLSLNDAFAKNAKMKIATIGAGQEGGALGTLFAQRGHQVMFSSRNPERLKDLVASAGPNTQAGTVADAISYADVVVIAVPYTALQQIGHEFAPALAKKALVFDVSNPTTHRDGAAMVASVAAQGGAGLVTAKLLPGSHLVRAFNAMSANGKSGAATLIEVARQGGMSIGVPIASDDRQATGIADTLIRELGLEPVLIGGLAMGKYLVPQSPLSGLHTPAELRAIAAKLS